MTAATETAQHTPGQALAWYAEKAESAARYLEQSDKGDAMLALLTELALDKGNRARIAANTLSEVSVMLQDLQHALLADDFHKGGLEESSRKRAARLVAIIAKATAA